MDPDVQADIAALKAALEANDEKAGVTAALSLLARALSDLHRIASPPSGVDPASFRVG